MSFAQEQAGQVRIAIPGQFSLLGTSIGCLYYSGTRVTLYPQLCTPWPRQEKEVCVSELKRESRTGPGSHTSKSPCTVSLGILKSRVELETLGKPISNFCNGQFLQYWKCKLRPQKARGSQVIRISVKLTSPLSSALAKCLDILPRKQKLECTNVFLLDFV